MLKWAREQGCPLCGNTALNAAKEGYLEILGNDGAVIFADVLGAELEFTGLDVPLTMLDESSIKHDSEECCVVEASMLKYDFYVTM